MKERGVRKKEFHVGLDIGTRLIKVIETSSEGNTQSLSKFQFAEIPYPQTHEKTAGTLKALLDDFHPTTKEINISLSAPSALVRFINMPKMKEEDLRNSLRFEAEKYIPFNINEVIIDASILEGEVEAENQMKVLLAAAKKEAVNSKIEMLKLLGFSIRIIDIDSFACFNAFCNSFEPSAGSGSPRALSGGDKLDESKSLAILNIGYNQTNVIISKGDRPYFTRDVQIGGKDMATAISQGLQIEEKEADKLIFNPQERSAQVLEVAKPILNNLVDELRLSFGYYENQHGVSINEIYISGGVARLGGILDYLEESFGIKPVVWNPFSRFELNPDLDAKLLELIRPLFAVCAGLAIRK